MVAVVASRYRKDVELPEKVWMLPMEEKAKYIKKLREKGYTYREIAKILKVSFRDISRVLKGTEKEEKLEKRVKALERKIDVLERMIKVQGLRLGRTVDVLLSTPAANKLAVYCPNCMRRTFIIEDARNPGRWICKFCGEGLFTFRGEL
ncbi:hypothetical protein DRP04_14470 [Archaeoglobales archaeon]|nr:MAG: hypothetical protein DRP04_14470 [Archaeoglobales archaeon]